MIFSMMGGGGPAASLNNLVKSASYALFPTDWSTSTTVGGSYVCANGVTLFSPSTGGVWGLENNATSRLYSNGSTWNVFQELSTGVLIGSTATGGAGVLFYRYSTKTITLVYASGNTWQYMVPVGDVGCIITSSNSSSPGVLFFDISMAGVTLLSATGYGQVLYLAFADRFIFAVSNGLAGIYRFDYASKSLSTLRSDGNWGQYYCPPVKTPKGGIFTSTGTPAGLCLYNYSTNTLSMVSTTGTSYVMKAFDDGAGVFAAQYSVSAYPIYYNDADGTVTNVSGASGYGSSFNVVPVPGGVLYDISNSMSLFFNASTKTSTTIANYGAVAWAYVVVDDGVFISSNLFNGPNIGVWFFKYATKTGTRLSTTGDAWLYARKVSGGYLISPSNTATFSGGGLFYLDATTLAFTNKISSQTAGIGWKWFTPVDGGYLVTGGDRSGSATHGILFYDDTAKTVTNLWAQTNTSPGYGYVRNTQVAPVLTGDGDALIVGLGYSVGVILLYSGTNRTCSMLYQFSSTSYMYTGFFKSGSSWFIARDILNGNFLDDWVLMYDSKVKLICSIKEAIAAIALKTLRQPKTGNIYSYKKI